MTRPDDNRSAATGQAARAVHEAVEASDYQRAAMLADAALSRGLVHPFFYIAGALWLERQGRDSDALALFMKARNLAPGDTTLLNAIGLCLIRLHRLDEALQAFRDAVRAEPGAAISHQRKAMVLGMTGRLDESEHAYEQALRLDPHNVETLASLASIASRKGDADRAREMAARAITLDPRNTAAHVALATIEISNGQFAAAEHHLRPVAHDPQISARDRGVIFALMGDALDGEGQYREAFEAYAAGNAERQRLHGQRFQRMPNAIARLDNLIAAFDESPDERWHVADKANAGGNGETRHVFLLGFPRSGTTLLEQALERHPDIVTLDEQDLLSDMAERFLGSRDALDRLSLLDENSLAIHRHTYWQRVRDFGIELPHKVFVDKQPFNTIKLPLIARLFPAAKVLFAVRDPRGVVFSCFRRQLDIDLLTFEFLTLEGTARIYDRFMRMGELCRSKLALAFFDCRYEELVADFDTATRAVCRFLGVEWDPSMRDFASASRSVRPHMASAQQLRRGLYREGVDHWYKYEVELKSVIPLLRPWIARFGYSPVQPSQG
ncbi:MAG TPA: sulfotransferase [Rhizomicrobium sp.]|jgi:tetratricopeptide (TPR) repeat protein